MNENWNSEIEEPDLGNRGRTTFVIVIVLGMLLVAGVVAWALLYGEPSVASTSDSSSNYASTAWIAILPAIIGGSTAARKRKGGAPANYTIPSVFVGLVVLIIVGVALLVGFGVL